MPRQQTLLDQGPIYTLGRITLFLQVFRRNTEKGNVIKTMSTALFAAHGFFLT